MKLDLDCLVREAADGDVDAAELAALALGLGRDEQEAAKAEARRVAEVRARQLAEDRELLRWLGGLR